MRDYEFLHVIEEICQTLELSRPTISYAIELLNKFRKSDTHKYKIDIMTVACVFLASKNAEETRKIRDIINCVFAVSALYRTSNQRAINLYPEKYENVGDHIKYIDLSEFVNPRLESDMAYFMPDFGYDKYLEIRDDVLQAEQHLLRVIDFDTRNEHKKGYLMLLSY